MRTPKVSTGIIPPNVDDVYALTLGVLTPQAMIGALLDAWLRRQTKIISAEEGFLNLI
jgi:hypothetical protein